MTVRRLLSIIAAVALVACGSLVDPEGNGGGVVSPAVRGLRLDAATISLAVGETRQVNVTAVNVAGQPVPPPPGQSIQLSSSDPAIFTVSPAGQLLGVASGTAVLRAQLGALSVGAGVTVIDNVDRLELVSGGGQTAAPGAPLADPLVVRAVAAGGAARAGVTVTFAPSAGSVAPVTAVTGSDGTASTRWTLGGTAGAQSVTASASGFRSVAIGATAVARPVVTIEVTPPTVTLTDVGRTQQFTARALDAAGTAIPGVAFTWSSSRTDVAVVNGTGLATAVAAGSSTITAAAGTVSGSAALTVTVPQPAPRLLLEPTSVTASATQTSTAAPQSLAPVQLREATGRPLADLGALTTDAPVYTSGQPTGWITARTLNTTTGALVLTVDPVNLAPGTYTASVPVRAALASNTPQPLAVQLTVTAASAPRIVVTPERWDPLRPARAVDAVTLDVAVTNGGSGTLNGLTAEVTYAAGQATGWLTATIGAAAPATLRLTASAAALDDGVYDGTVTIRSSVSGVAAVTVPVRLTVSAVGRPRVFLNGSEVTFAPLSDSAIIGVGGAYGTVDFPLDFALADAAGRRLRPAAPPAPNYFGGVPGGPPAEAWLQAAATDSGVQVRIRHTPVLRVGTYRAATTVTVPGLQPIVVVIDYFNNPRLVALANAADTTSIVGLFQFPLDQGIRNVLPANPLLRQIGGWCRRGEYRVAGPGGAALPAWLRAFNASASVQVQTLALLAVPSAVDPGATVAVNPQTTHEVPSNEILQPDCLLPGSATAGFVFRVEATAPSYRLATNVDTLVLVPDVDGRPSGEFDLDVIPAVAAPPCTAFSVPQTSVQAIIDPADEVDGFDVNQLGTGLFGLTSATRPSGTTQRITLNATGLRGGRSYVYGLAYFPSFRCQDGIQPYTDTLWVRFSVAAGGSSGTLALRGRGNVAPLPDGVLPFEGFTAALNPNSEAVAPNGFPPGYDLSVYYDGGPPSPDDQIVLDTILYPPGAQGWLRVDVRGGILADTVAFFNVGLSPTRPPLTRGEYRATVRLRSVETGQVVSFPYTLAVGGRDGQLSFAQVAVGFRSGCGIAGNPATGGPGDQLFCWGQVGTSLLRDGVTAGYWHDRTDPLARQPFPMSDSALRQFSTGLVRPEIIQIRSSQRNIAMLVESAVDGQNYVLLGGFIAGGSVTNPDLDVLGLRPLLRGGAPVQARSIALAQFGNTACAVGTTGQPFCVGSFNLSLGLDNLVIRDFSVPEPMDSVVVSGNHACAWRVGGNAYCWGADNDGQLGRGVFAGSPPYPVAQVPGISDVRSMSVAASTTCARTGSGIFCWGSNSDGLIYGRTLGARFNTPQAVTPPVTDFHFVNTHACGRSSTTPGALFCWGVEFAPGGAVSGPVGSRPVTTGYREVLWPVTVQRYEVGRESTCYASFGLWSCAGGTGNDVGTGGGSIAVTTPRFILGQQPALIGNLPRTGGGTGTLLSQTGGTRGGTPSSGLLNTAGQWLRGLFRRESPSAPRGLTTTRSVGAPTATARGARPRSPDWRALPARRLDGSTLPPAPPPAPTVRVKTMPLEEFLRRPLDRASIRVQVGSPGHVGASPRSGAPIPYRPDRRPQ